MHLAPGMAQQAQAACFQRHKSCVDNMKVPNSSLTAVSNSERPLPHTCTANDTSFYESQRCQAVARKLLLHENADKATFVSHFNWQEAITPGVGAGGGPMRSLFYVNLQGNTKGINAGVQQMEQMPTVHYIADLSLTPGRTYQLI